MCALNPHADERAHVMLASCGRRRSALGEGVGWQQRQLAEKGATIFSVMNAEWSVAVAQRVFLMCTIVGSGWPVSANQCLQETDAGKKPARYKKINVVNKEQDD